MKKTLTNWMCLSGSLAAVFYFLHDLVGQRHYPGYNWLEQAVSDLTAVHAPSRAFGCMLFGAVGANNVPDAYFGLVERFSTYSAVLFTAILGLYGFTFFDRRENLISMRPQETVTSKGV